MPHSHSVTHWSVTLFSSVWSILVIIRGKKWCGKDGMYLEVKAPIILKFLAFIFFLTKKKVDPGVPVMAQQKQIQPGTMRLQVQSLGSLSGLRIPHCRELWCSSQTPLIALIAAAMCCRLAAVSPIWPLAWGPPYASSEALKTKKKKKVDP